MRGLVTALGTRVPGAAEHSRRVAAHSCILARRLGLDQRQVDDPQLTAIVVAESGVTLDAAVVAAFLL